MQMRRLWDDTYPFHLITNCRKGLAPFGDSASAEIVRKTVLKSRRKDDVFLFAWCLMPDHLHLCVAEREKNISTYMMVIKRLISREMGLGQLWEPRFWDNQIMTMREFRDVIHYIHGNPVRAGIVEEPEQYSHGSARDWESLDFNIFLEFGREV